MTTYEQYTRVARVKAVEVGGTLTSPFEMSDRQGHPIHKGETVEVVLKTRNTVHVKDQRGVVHRRYYYFFDA